MEMQAEDNGVRSDAASGASLVAGAVDILMPKPLKMVSKILAPTDLNVGEEELLRRRMSELNRAAAQSGKVAKALDDFKIAYQGSNINFENLRYANKILLPKALILLADLLIGQGLDEIVAMWISDNVNGHDVLRALSDLISVEHGREKLYPEPRRTMGEIEAITLMTKRVCSILGVTPAALAYLVRYFQSVHPEDIGNNG